jgi:hypothetical protein
MDETSDASGLAAGGHDVAPAAHSACIWSGSRWRRGGASATVGADVACAGVRNEYSRTSQGCLHGASCKTASRSLRRDRGARSARPLSWSKLRARRACSFSISFVVRLVWERFGCGTRSRRRWCPCGFRRAPCTPDATCPRFRWSGLRETSCPGAFMSARSAELPLRVGTARAHRRPLLVNAGGRPFVAERGRRCTCPNVSARESDASRAPAHTRTTSCPSIRCAARMSVPASSRLVRAAWEQLD